MLSLRLLLRFTIPTTALFLCCSLLASSAGCGDDDGGGSGGGGSGGGTRSPDASDVVDILGGLKDSGTNPSLGDGGRQTDGGTADAAGPLCGNGRLDGAEICDPALDPCCTNTCDGPIADGHVCRPAAGVCDQAEACNGRQVDCPADERVDDDTVCRRADGECDRAERCDGHAVDCPDDEHAAEGTECRASEGPCDPAEACDGEHADCPDDELAEEGTECRPKDGQCDRPEECDGEDADCPTDVLRPAGYVCREASTDCDADELCDGVSEDCPTDLPADDSVSCRDAADACDAEEFCSGSSKACPADLPEHCSTEVLGGVLPFTVSGTTSGTCATYVPTCSTMGNANEHEYVFTAPRSDTFRFHTFGSSYDTVIAVRDGNSCGAAEIACNDDSRVGVIASVVDVELSAGETVLIIVDGFNGLGGNFELTVRDADDFEDWTCDSGELGDGDCDCGCGSVDEDCDDETSESCESCLACGEREAPCSGSAKVVADDNSQCTGWICPNSWYNADDGCDCGCGALDPDCPGTDPAECEFCDACGDPHVPCGDSARVDSEDGRLCAATWACDPTFYASGDGCDCGCGLIDPDCESALSSACYYCDPCGDTADACAGSASIDPNHNTQCAPVTPVWTCDPDWRGMDDGCDCGCGEVDPDCASEKSEECEFCGVCRDIEVPCASSAHIVEDNNARCR